MVKFNSGCTARILAVALLICMWSFFSEASDLGEKSTDRLQHHVDIGKLHHSIKMQMDHAGEAEVLVLLDGSEANTKALDTKKRHALMQDNDDIIKDKARLHKKKKENLLTTISGGKYGILKDYENFPILHMKINKAALETLLEQPEVNYVVGKVAFSRKLSNSLPFVGAIKANNYGATGSGTSIAVLDTAVNYTLPEFGSCSSPGAPIGCKVSFAQDFTTSGGSLGNSDHATNVASIIVGVAPDTKILALNVFSSDGYAYETDVIAALDWVLSNRTTYSIVAVNLSLGTGKYTAACNNLAVARVIDDLKNAGIATVVSSGNSGYSDAMAYPACSSSAVSVGAVYDGNVNSSMYWQEANCTDSSPVVDQVACFSDSAPFLTMLAPGAPMVNAGNISLAGTSQASAHVAGAMALLKGINPLLTVDGMISRLTSTGIPVMDARNGITSARLDIDAAVNANVDEVVVKPTQTLGGNSSSKSNSTDVTGGNGVVSNVGTKNGTGTSKTGAGQNGNHQIAGPGWLTTNAPAVSHDEAMAYFNSVAKSTGNQSANSGVVKFKSMSATDTTPEITELARALMNDPKIIYDYVHNNIDYVPYYGSLKGATLTYLDGSGNDFDQASLMIALLRVSGYTARYVYGTMTIPGSQLANWGGVDQLWQTIGTLWPSGGVPLSNLYTDGTATIDRVWVQATINGTNYLFDPAFKTYTSTNKINLATAMGYSQADFLAGATSGATVGSNYVQNLNEGNIRSKLATYSNNLVSTIRSQYPNNNVEDIVGGRSIVPTTTTQYSTTLPFSPSVTTTFSDITTDKITTLRIQHVGIDYTVNTPDLAGKRLTLTYAGSDNHPELRLDGTLLASGTATTMGSSNNCIVSINHPYAAYNGTYQDQSVNYTPISGSSYAIVYNFGGVSDTLIQKLQQQLTTYKAQGLADSSESVLCETLHLMGMTWLKEVMQSMKLLTAVTENVPIMHHNVGFMAQETGYYIDVKVGSGSLISKHNIDSDQAATIKAYPLVASAFEHGILEQLMGSSNPGISTMKLFQIANAASGKIYSVTSSNILSVKTTLQALPANEQYSSADWTNFQNIVANGNTIILPDNGQLTLNRWKGKGYISKNFSSNAASMSMIIGGNLFGGYNSTSGPVSTPIVTQNTQAAQVATSTPSSVNLNISTVAPSTSRDPVDMAGGSFLVDHTDLVLGGTAPLGLAFNRSYTSADAMSKQTMGYGWDHGYDIYLTPTSHGEPGLGLRQPVDAASMIAALYVNYDILSSFDDASTWVTASLASKWAVDQVINNAVVVHAGKKVMEFIALADGSYASPPGITTKLVKNGDGTFSLLERFGTRTDFNSANQIAKITDVNGNIMSFTYSGTNLSTVTDAFNHSLTLGYDGSGRVNSVTDSTGRSVGYGYTNNELTSYTDPENKTWGFGYSLDNSHRLTTLTNPLTITTATNAYDTLGRVKTQTVPRQGAPGTTATYNFYFSGYRNVEQDPIGYTTTYYYDRKGREYAVENALGNRITKQYDGQNHAVLITDPRLNSTSYIFDGNQNLATTTNAVSVFSYVTTYQYDSLLRLSDIFDPSQHNTHFEYDSRHHLTLTRDNLSNTTQATYNGPKGAKDTATDGRSTVTNFTYDVNGNPHSKTIANHPSIIYEYDSIGRMTDLFDQANSHTSFFYDKRGLVKTVTDPSRTLSTTMAYYDDGSLWTKTDRNGNTITYVNTPSGKLDHKSYPGGATVNYTYNNLDQVTAMQDSIGITGIGYDPTGKINSVTDPNNFNVSYLYDAAGNLSQLTYPGNKKVIYTYDELNRLKTVTIDWLSGKPVATYNYKPNELNLLDNLVAFNGITTTYSFDTANRLTGISIPSVASYSFPVLDGNGNRQNVTQTEPLPIFLASDTTYGYTYNTTKNRLQSDGTNSFGYDNEGQLNSGYGNSYTFDYEHRLTAMSGASFNYDDAGNRLMATRNGVTTKYIYDVTGNLLAEADVNNNITRYYVYGAGLLAMVTPAGQIFNYHFNVTGNTVAMTDQSQTMVNKYAYEPFGRIANQQETIVQPFKYVGQFGVMAETNGFYYMKARYYDSNVGRFISEDPKGFDGGDDNLMAYVGGNPVMRTDPSGEFINFGAAGAGFVIGGVVGGISAVVSGTDFWKGALVGGLTGATAGFTLGSSLVVNAAFGAAAAGTGDYLLQKWRGESTDWGSVGTSAFVGAIGGGIGGAMARGGSSAIDSASWSGAISGGMSSGLSINQNTNYTLHLGCGR